MTRADLHNVGQIAGIAVSVSLGVLCLTLLSLCLQRKRQRKEEQWRALAKRLSKHRRQSPADQGPSNTAAPPHKYRYDPPEATHTGKHKDQSGDISYETTNQNSTYYNQSEGKSVEQTIGKHLRPEEMDQPETSYDALDRGNKKNMHEELRAEVGLYHHKLINADTEDIYENQCLNTQDQYDHVDKSHDTSHHKTKPVIPGYTQVTLDGN